MRENRDYLNRVTYMTEDGTAHTITYSELRARDALSAGTYARERDGSTRTYYSPALYMNAAYALETSGTDWRPTTDDERAALDVYCGPLSPGEYVEVPAV